MKKIIFIFILIAVLFSSISISQVTQEWVKIFQGNNGAYVEARDFKKDIFENLIIAGYAITGNNADFLLLKYDKNGQLLFSRQFDTTSEGGRVVTTDLDGNIYITGDASGLGSYTRVIKYDQYGNLIWTSIINPVIYGSGIPVSIKWHNDNIYLTGNVFDSGGSDIYLVKYNNAGIQQWIKRYNSPPDSFDSVINMQIDNNSNIYLCGNSFISIYDDDYLIVKYDTIGNMLWGKNIDDGNTENNFTASFIDIQNNIYMTGSSQGKYFTVKINSQGSVIWKRFYTGSELGSQAEGITGDENHNIYITGQSKDSTIVNYNIATLKYNDEGDLIWVARYSGPGLNYDKPSSITIDKSNNVYVTGFITNLSNNRDFVTLKYDINGILIWDQIYNSNGFDEAIGIYCDTNRNIYVCGNSTNNGSSSIRTIKYSQPIGINPISSQIPSHFSLSQNYPNPFNPVTKIKFDIPSVNLPLQGGDKEGVSLIVYDILGREIEILVNEQLYPGKYEVDWDASAYPSGVYFYKLISGDFTETKKMVVLK